MRDHSVHQLQQDRDNLPQQGARQGFMRPGSMATPQIRHRQFQQAGKVIDWEAFHYGMLDHRYLNDPNPAKASHRRTIYELWVGELIGDVLEGQMAVYSKDGKLPKRLANENLYGRTPDLLIGCLFDSEKLLRHMEEYFNNYKEVQ